MNIILTILIAVVSAIGVYQYLPLSVLEYLPKFQEEPKYGATITTIAGSDTISGSRATINTNFSNLNSDKTEVSSTTIGNITSLPNLVTVGTLTSGSLGSGFTTVTVARGGTGSTTLALGLVLTGSTTNAIGTVAGYGTSGQFLTSQGAAKEPQWTTSSVNEAGTYAWTGSHSFSSATTTFNATTSHTGMFQQGEWGGIMPVGALTAYASSTPPQGWLLCNGQTVSRTIYARLFHVIGTTYGVGDGSTTFTLPDVRNRKITMASTTGNIAQTGGEANHTLLTAELAAHTHTLPDTDSVTNGTAALRTNDGSGNAGSLATDSAGSGTAHNVLDPYMAMYYLIRY